jgi:hypothetical protein
MESKTNEGTKHDLGKPKTSLIPVAAELEEAAVWTFGEKKYAAFNWHKGLKYGQIIAAIERHTKLYKAGLTIDYETKLHHAAAIRCCAAMLIQFDLEGRTELDDRMVLTEETKRKIEAMAQGKNVWEIF